MGRMLFGSTLLTTDPNEIDPILKPRRICSVQPTYDGVAFFSWGSTIEGSKHTLKWGAMSAVQYDEIQALIEADASLLWTPVSGEASAYTIQLLDLRGEYIHSIGTTFFGGAAYRKNCELDLVIMEIS